MRQLIVTGDDFGLAIPVNEAIEDAHRYGILTTASLMVSAGAAEDAIERATRLPTLKIGLHLVLVEGRPVLPPSTVPALVNEHGAFSSRLVRAGCNCFFRPAVRRQLEAEIRAQFEAFNRTGLQLDHVNAHNHMHLHPTILGLILKVGGEFGLRAIRLPHEPLMPSWRAAGRRSLEPLRVTPLQAGVLLFLRRHPEAKVTDAADSLVVRQQTVSEVLHDLVRKRWVTKRYSVEDRRVVCVQLSRRGPALSLHIEERVPQVNATLAEEARKALGMTPKGSRA